MRVQKKEETGLEELSKKRGKKRRKKEIKIKNKSRYTGVGTKNKRNIHKRG